MSNEPQENRPKRKLETRNVEDLTLHPQHSVFAEPTEAEIEVLASSIQERGLQHPVEILPDGQIIAGRKRWLALQKLGQTKCTCWVRYDLAAEGEHAIVRHLVYDNVERRQHRPLEIARAYALAKSTYVRALDPDPRDMRDILAERFGISGGSLDRLCRILDAPRIVQDAFERGELRLVDAAKVGRMPPSTRSEIASEIADGEPPQDVVDRHLGRDRAGQAAKSSHSSTTEAGSAVNSLIAATAALVKALERGEGFGLPQRQSLIFVVRRLHDCLRRQR